MSSKSGKIQRLKSYKPQNNLDQVHVDFPHKPLFKTYPTHKNYYSRKLDSYYRLSVTNRVSQLASVATTVQEFPSLFSTVR